MTELEQYLLDKLDLLASQISISLEAADVTILRQQRLEIFQYPYCYTAYIRSNGAESVVVEKLRQGSRTEEGHGIHYIPETVVEEEYDDPNSLVELVGQSFYNQVFALLKTLWLYRKEKKQNE